MRKRIFLALVATALCSPAMAQSIDLKKVWGDRNGCINRNGQEQAFDKMLLLKENNLVMAYSVCAISKTATGKGGSLTLQTRCDAEGEESDATFIVRPARKKGSFLVTDESGNQLGQISRCR